MLFLESVYCKEPSQHPPRSKRPPPSKIPISNLKGTSSKRPLRKKNASDKCLFANVHELEAFSEPGEDKKYRETQVMML